jgi:hypothetical protein
MIDSSVSIVQQALFTQLLLQDGIFFSDMPGHACMPRRFFLLQAMAARLAV